MMQILQKFHAQLLSSRRQASYSPLRWCLSGFILVLGATYLTAQINLLSFPLLHHVYSVLPALAKLNLHDAWASLIILKFRQLQVFACLISPTCNGALLLLPLYPHTPHTSEHLFKDLFCPPHAAINWGMVGP